MEREYFNLDQLLRSLSGRENVQIFDYETKKRLHMGTAQCVPTELKQYIVAEIILDSKIYLGMDIYVNEWQTA